MPNKNKTPKTIIVEGQAWTVVRRTYWESNTGGGYRDSAYEFVRVADGRMLTTPTRERGIACIAERIKSGIY